MADVVYMRWLVRRKFDFEILMKIKVICVESVSNAK